MLHVISNTDHKREIV